MPLGLWVRSPGALQDCIQVSERGVLSSGGSTGEGSSSKLTQLSTEFVSLLMKLSSRVACLKPARRERETVERMF